MSGMELVAVTFELRGLLPIVSAAVIGLAIVLFLLRGKQRSKEFDAGPAAAFSSHVKANGIHVRPIKACHRVLALLASHRPRLPTPAAAACLPPLPVQFCHECVQLVVPNLS